MRLASAVALGSVAEAVVEKDRRRCGPNPPGPEGSEFGGQEPGSQPASDQPTRAGAESAAPDTGQTEIHSQAYSAPESEQFTSGPYVPADASLYDYVSYEPVGEAVDVP